MATFAKLTNRGASQARKLSQASTFAWMVPIVPHLARARATASLPRDSAGPALGVPGGGFDSRRLHTQKLSNPEGLLGFFFALVSACAVSVPLRRS